MDSHAFEFTTSAALSMIIICQKTPLAKRELVIELLNGSFPNLLQFPDKKSLM